MSSQTDVSKRPNVVFITVDQWRGDLAPGRKSWLNTPNLDALAAEAVSFAAHYCQAYPCGPARASLLTGLYPHKHRSIQNGSPLDARHRTLFQAARAVGYAPILFGYTDTTLDPRQLTAGDPARANYENVAPGLDIGCLLDEAARPWIAHLIKKGINVPDPSKGRDQVFKLRNLGEPTVFDAEDSETAFLTDRFLAHLSTQGTEPLFAHISYIAPHPPFAAASHWLEQIDMQSVELPQIPYRAKAEHPLMQAYRNTLSVGSFVPNASGAPHQASPEVIRAIRRAYAALALEVDFHVGRIIDALKAGNSWEKTIFILSGDHGEQLFDHGLLGKLGWFDASAHIPLIIRAPGMPGGKTIGAFTEAVDVFPTLIDLLGLEHDINLDGRSLLPHLMGQSTAWRDAVYWSHDFRNLRDLTFERQLSLPSALCNLHVVRTSEFKYVHFPGLPPVFYNLTEDPHESTDRTADPAMRTFRTEGLERLLNHRLSHENEELSCLQAVGDRLYGERYAQRQFGR